MLSEIPFDLSRLDGKELDREIVRVGMIAELDAVSLYEQLASMTDHPLVKAVFLDIAKEEKTHMGEFQALLLRLDEEQAQELEAGREEVAELESEL
jgi:rubrerythrin